MFQRTEFTSQIRRDDCPGSPTPCAEFSGFPCCSVCSMRSVRSERAPLEAQRRSQLEEEFAAAAFFTCCSGQLQEPSWKHQLPVSRLDERPFKTPGDRAAKCAGLRTFAHGPRSRKMASCFLTSNELYVCYRTKSRRSKRVYRSGVI